MSEISGLSRSTRQMMILYSAVIFLGGLICGWTLCLWLGALWVIAFAGVLGACMFSLVAMLEEYEQFIDRTQDRP